MLTTALNVPSVVNCALKVAVPDALPARAPIASVTAAALVIVPPPIEISAVAVPVANAALAVFR
jgi:hypothetical protein